MHNSYHASINGSCCEQIKLVKGYRRGVIVLSHADGVRSCRCVRCLNQPSWGRLWRSWASAHTATSPSFTQIHPLLKHWACLWRGECLPCRWWMLQVTTHIANFPVSSCTCIILLSSPFWKQKFIVHVFRSQMSHISFPYFSSQRKGCGHLLQIWCHCKLYYLKLPHICCESWIFLQWIFFPRSLF